MQETGHYGSQCLTKRNVAAMTSHRTETNSETDQETDGTDQDSVFLDAITGQSNTETTQWTVTIALNRVKENFKIDTGAEVTAITETAYQNIGAPVFKPQWEN